MSKRRPINGNGAALQAAISLAFAMPAAAQPAPSARPQGGQVVAGSAAIATAPATTTITQSSNRAAIDWRSFDVGSQQSVVFNQPGPNSVTLNRVTGPDPSAIAGRISANGQLVLTNPSGVVFHAGAQVNAQSVVVSAPGISNRNFMAGRMVFDQQAQPTARIENAGAITVKQAGLAALVAPSVANSGTITARLGHVVLAGAAAHTLDMYGDGLVSIDITKQVTQAPVGPGGKSVTALVTNSGTIAADGGTVQLSARAADGVVGTLVQAGGRIQANTAGGQSGRIEIAGTGGSVVIEGRVVADGRAPGTTGGGVAIAGSDATILTPTARVSASGRAGGGTVAVGTSLARARGTGPAPAGTSARTSVAAGARISADATANGDGGRVTVLSTQSTSMGGTATARGGRSGGNGGTIELSGETGFRLTGTADTSAPHGTLGTVVLDPRDLTVTDTPTGSNVTPQSGDPSLGYAQGGTTTDAYVTPAQIENLTGNVHLQASRDLVVASSFGVGTTEQGTNTSGGDLTLEAGRNLTVNSGVTITVPGLHGPSSSTPGTVTLTAASSNIPGFDPSGTLTVLGTVQTSAIVLNAGTGGIVLGGTLDTTYVTAPNAINATRMTTPGPVQQNGGALVTGDLSGSVGSLSLTSASNQIAGAGSGAAPLVASAGPIAIVDSVALSVGSGDAGSGTTGLAVPSGSSIALTADSLTLQSGSAGTALSAPGGTVTLQPYTPGTPIVLTSSTAKPEGALALTTAETALIDASTLQFTGPSSSLTFGQSGDAPIDLVTNGNFAQVLVDVGGSVGQAATLSVNALARSPTAAVPLNLSLADPANSIPVIRDLASRNDLVVTTGGDMAVSGGIAAASSLELSAGNNLLIGADATLSGPTSLYLSAGTVNNAGALTVAGTVSVGDGGAFLAGSGGIALSGTVSLSGALNVSTSGSLTQSGGSLSVDLLLGRAASVSLPSRGNALNGITSFTVDAGDFLLVNSLPTTVSAPGGDGGNVGLSLPAGHTATLVTDYLAIPSPVESGFPIVATGGGTLVVAPYTPGGTVLLTSSVKPATGLSLTTTELGLVDAATLQIGGTTPFAPQAGAITVGQTGDSPIDLVSLGISRLALSATGSVSQTVPLGVTTLAGSAGSVALANAGNFIQVLDGLAAPGDIAVHTSSGLLVSNPVSSGGNLSLSSELPISERGDNTSMLLAADLSAPTIRLDTTNGEGGTTGIRQTGGIVTTGTLSGVADTLSLTQANQITNLGAFTAYNGLTLTNAQPLVVTGAVVATGGPVTLNAPGITQTATSSITAPELDGSATADTVLDSRLNAISSIGTFTQSDGNFTLVTASPSLSVGTGQISAPNGSLTFVADAVSVVPVPAPDTTISAPTGSVTVSPYTPSRPIIVVGAGLPPSTANALVLPTDFPANLHADTLVLGRPGYAGPITIGGANQVIDLSTFRALQLQTTGAVTEGTGATLIVSSLTGSGGSISLPGNNQLSALGLGRGGTPVGLAATAGALTVGNTLDLTTVGPISATTALTLSTAPVAGLSVNGSLAAPAVSLFVGGALAQDPAASITASTLAVSAASASLTSAANRVGTLASTVAGDLTLTDGIGLDIAGGSTVGGTLTLAVAGPVTGGSLTARALTGSATSVALTAAANRIPTLGPFATTGGFNLVTAQTLTVTGPVSDPGAISLTVARDLTLAGALSSPGGVVTLNAGTITQPGGTVTAGTLAGSVAGSATLGQAGNAVGTLAGFSTGGDLTLVDGIGLGIAGGTVGGTLNFAVAGPVTGGGITAAGLTGSATALTLTGAGTRIASLGPFATTAGFSLADAQSLTVSGTVSDPGAIALTVGGDLTLAASLNSPAGTVTLNAQNIAQPGGAITAATLTGTATGSATLAQPGNAVTTLAGFTTSGDFTLADSRSVTVSAPVDANTVTMTVTGDLTLASTMTGSAVVLDATGAIVEGPGGRIVADLLTIEAGRASLNGTNQVATLGATTTQTGFTLTDTGALTVAGPSTDGTAIALSAAGPIILAGDVVAPMVSLNATGGAVTQVAGSLGAGILSGSADSIDLGRSGVAAIGRIDGLAATGQPSGSLTVVDTTPLQLSGTVSGRFVSITAAGSLVLTDGTAIRTDGQPTSAQLGSADAGPGSNLSVRPGADGRASLVQAGRVTVAPLTATAATLRIDLPQSGGTVALNNLQASNADLVLNLGSGSATGTLVARNLTVLGSSGRATLSGSVGGASGNRAAATSTLLPRLDTLYTLNGCVISIATCSALTLADVPSIAQPEAAIASITSAISSVIRPDILALDVLDLSVTRDRDDPTLLLPNISDKDY